MQREAPRTLYSLSPEYQEGVTSDDYEVLVIENGSTSPLDNETVSNLPGNFRHLHIPNPHPSPVRAANYGSRLARSKFLGFMVDGARIVTPGIVRNALAVFQVFKNPFVATLGWHLGRERQQDAVKKDYCAAEEDEQLKSINWQKDGYRLFEISCLAPSSGNGWFGPLQESNCFFMKKKTFRKMGMFDERFNLPGGGFVNLDFYNRAVKLKSMQHVILLGEGSFHQVHGGISTNDANPERLRGRQREWLRQYRDITGQEYMIPQQNPVYFGRIHDFCKRFIVGG
jgi:hypothetical protein